MQAGSIIFVKGTSLLSSLIRCFDEGGNFSHVAICVSHTHILEAQYGTKTRIAPFYFTDYEVVDLKLTDEERDKIVHLGIQLIGRQYDYSDIIRYLIKGLFGVDNKKLNSPNNLICSEVIDTLLFSIDKIPEDIYLGGHTPNELYKYLKSNFE